MCGSPATLAGHQAGDNMEKKGPQTQVGVFISPCACVHSSADAFLAPFTRIAPAEQS